MGTGMKDNLRIWFQEEDFRMHIVSLAFYMRLSEKHILGTLSLCYPTLYFLCFGNKIMKKISSISLITFRIISEVLLDRNQDVHHGIMHVSMVKNKLLNFS